MGFKPIVEETLVCCTGPCAFILKCALAPASVAVHGSDDAPLSQSSSSPAIREEAKADLGGAANITVNRFIMIFSTSREIKTSTTH